MPGQLSPDPSGSPTKAGRERRGADEIELLEWLNRHKGTLILGAILGSLIAQVYVHQAEVWYESRAVVLVEPKPPLLAQQPDFRRTVVDDETLASLQVLLQSRVILAPVARGLASHSPPSTATDLDPVEQIRRTLRVTRGGTGSARDARTLNLALSRSNPQQARTLLRAILDELLAFNELQQRRSMTEQEQALAKVRRQLEVEQQQAADQLLKTRQDFKHSTEIDGGSSFWLSQLGRIRSEIAAGTREETRLRTLIDLQLKFLAPDADQITLLGRAAALMPQEEWNRWRTAATATAGSSSEGGGSQTVRVEVPEELVALWQQQLELKIETQRQLFAELEDASRNWQAARDYEQTVSTLEQRLKRVESELEGFAGRQRQLLLNAGMAGVRFEIIEMPESGLPVWPLTGPLVLGGTLAGTTLAGAFALFVSGLCPFPRRQLVATDARDGNSPPSSASHAS